MANLQDTTVNGVLTATEDVMLDNGVRLSDLADKQDELPGGVFTGSFDTNMTPGWYYCAFSNTSGSPYTNGYGFFTVMQCTGSSYVQIIYRCRTTTPLAIGEISIRCYINSAWVGWRTIYTADDTWTNLPLASNFEAGEGRTPQYRLNAGRVELKGQVSRTSGNFTTSSTAFATLPAGYRPTETLMFQVGDSSFSGARVAILATGALQANSANNSSYIALDGISFAIN